MLPTGKSKTGLVLGMMAVLGMLGTMRELKAGQPAAPAAPAPRKIVVTKLATVDDVKTLLTGITTVRAVKVGNTVVLDGTVSNNFAAQRMAILAKSFDNVINMTEKKQDKEFDHILSESIKAKIGLPGVVVNIVQGTVVLEGWVVGPADAKKAERIARVFAGTNLINNIEVKDEMVEIDVAFVKIDNKDSLDARFNLLTGFTLQNAASVAFGPAALRDVRYGDALFSQSSTLAQNVIFNFIATNDNLEVLERPHLSTLSRTPARFQQGGEIGIRIATDNSVGVDYHEFGIILDILPEITQKGLIKCLVTFEVSAPDVAPNGFGDVVNFSKVKTVSTAWLKNGESLVLSGIMRDIRSKLRQGVPYLRRIPVLGHFFSDKNKAKQHSDLMIVISPRVPTTVKATAESFAHEGARKLGILRKRRVKPVYMKWKDLRPEEKEWKNGFKLEPATPPSPKPSKKAGKEGAELPLPADSKAKAVAADGGTDKAQVVNVGE